MRVMGSRFSVRKLGSAMALVFLSRSFAPAQQAGGGAMQEAVQAKLAQVKQDAAANKAALAKYGWMETIQVAVNGEVKQTKQMSCRYGPDGKPQCAPVGDQPPPQQERRAARPHRREEEGRVHGLHAAGQGPHRPLRAARWGAHAGRPRRRQPLAVARRRRARPASCFATTPSPATP